MKVDFATLGRVLGEVAHGIGVVFGAAILATICAVIVKLGVLAWTWVLS